MKKAKSILSIMTAAAIMMAFSGCTEANMVSRNLSQEADNFNVIRRLTVMNARSDNVMFDYYLLSQP